MGEAVERHRRAARATDDPDLARVLTDEADALSHTLSTRHSRVAGCPTCDKDPGYKKLMPPHDASPLCESGRREHCSCNVCF